MDEEPTTVIIQRYLDALPGDATAEPAIRALLERAVGRESDPASPARTPQDRHCSREKTISSDPESVPFLST